jgi:oligosaccharide repeat unit polymerase
MHDATNGPSMFIISRFRQLIFLACLFTVALDAWVYSMFAARSAGFILSAIVFWLTVLAFPSVLDSVRIIRPRNYVFAMFFLTMVLSPPVLYMNGSLLTGWILSYNPNYWDYFDYTLFLWNVSFLAYAVGLLGRRQRPAAPKGESEPVEQASNWMLYAGLVLVALGAAGLILGAGSLRALLAIKGQRELALEMINVSGKGRYIVWYSCIPYGACLIWFYTFKRLRLGPVKAMALLFLLYVPFVPFYSFTSGRATTLLPFIMLIALYYKYCCRISFKWFLVMFAPLPILLGFWALYRQDGMSFATDETFLRLGVQVLMDSFSRLDVSVAAIAGFHEGHLPYFWGKTLLAALTHPIPSWIVDFADQGGTMAMAKAVFVDALWDEPSGMASPLMVEGYLNFGFLGMVLFMLMLGYLTRRTEDIFDSKRILFAILGLALTFQLPFGAALQVITAGAFWTVLFPFLVSFAVYRVMRNFFVIKSSGT